LKLFPRLEELWHTGAVSRSVAAPAMATLSRLARALCVIEQEKGEPFVEPLQKTLANCGQFQSLYLTSSAGASGARERPEWLMDEVGRLMAQAERLAAEGRPIEAGGVATLAEWRARGLEWAAKAQPLSAPEKEVKPAEVAPPPAKKAKAPDAKAAPKAAKDKKPQEPAKQGKPTKGKKK